MTADLAATAVGLGVFTGAAHVVGDHRAAKHLAVVGSICLAVAILTTIAGNLLLLPHP